MYSAHLGRWLPGSLQMICFWEGFTFQCITTDGTLKEPYKWLHFLRNKWENVIAKSPKNRLTIPKNIPYNKKKCLMIQKKVAWQLSGMFSGIVSEMPKTCTWKLALQKSTDQLENSQASFWGRQAIFLGLSGNFFRISCLMLGYKKEPKQVNGRWLPGIYRVFLYSPISICAKEVNLLQTTHHILHTTHYTLHTTHYTPHTTH